MVWSHRWSAAGCGSVLMMLYASQVSGQAVPQSVAPGQIEKRFEAPIAPREAPEPTIPRLDGEVPPVQADAVRFTLSGIEIEGATVFREAEFVPIYEPLLARDVALADIYKIAAAITAKYQEKGYILSRAVVPEQQVDLGIIRIRVVEGYLDQIIFRGDVEGSPELLQSYAEKITQVQPLRRDVLERYLLLMSDLPGVTLTHALTPSPAGEGAHTLTITLQHKSVEGFLRADNRGSRYVGPYQLWAGVGLNSVFGLYESTRMRFITATQTEELRYIDLAHTENVGTEGTKVTLSASHSRSFPGFTLEDSNIESRGFQAEASLAHPAIRSKDEDLFLTSRFTLRNSERDEQGIEVFDDRLRVIRAGLRYSFTDGLKGRNNVSVEGSQGIAGLGATDNDSSTLSRAGGRHDFAKATVDLFRYQPLFPQWGAQFAATGQKSAHKLLLSEQIGIGGEGFGRAYDPSEITGDDGIAFRVELQRDGSFGGRLLRQYQIYGFYDVGEVWTRGSDDGAALASVGLGTRVLADGGLLGSLEIAKPLTRPVQAMGDDGKDVRLFFTLTASF